MLTRNIVNRDRDLMEEAVDRGWHALCEYFGGTSWVDEIDTERFNVGNPAECPCGQLFDDYTNGLGELGIDVNQAGLYGLSMLSAEFVYDDIDDAYAELTQEWKDRILNTRDFRDRQDNLGFASPSEKHAINVTIPIMLTEEEIGKVYIQARDRGISVEEYVERGICYLIDASEGLDI